MVIRYTAQRTNVITKVCCPKRCENTFPTQMFITALLTIAEKWKQDKLTSANELINKMWQTHAQGNIIW